MNRKTFTGLSIITAALGLAAFSAPANATCETDTDEHWECLEVETFPGSGTYVDRTNRGLQGTLPPGPQDKALGAVPFTFEGPASLQHWFVGTLNCSLMANGYAGVQDFMTNPPDGQADVEVVGLTSTGAGNCGLVTFGGLPLMAYEGDTFTTPGLRGVNHGDVFDKHGFDPAAVHSHNAFGTLGSTGAGATLKVYYDGTLVCDDSVDLEFGNDVLASGNKNNRSFFAFNTVMSGWGGNCTVNGTLDTADANGAPYHDVNAW